MAGVQPVHGTVVARYGRRGWQGVLLRGPSGAGKSDMALRLIDAGWQLVADDYVHLWASGGGLYACPPDRIAGRMEARAFDIVTTNHRPTVRVVLIVDCDHTPPERLQGPERQTLAGIDLPCMTLDIRPASAIVTLGHVIDRL